jgi:hypothetical protein
VGKQSRSRTPVMPVDSEQISQIRCAEVVHRYVSTMGRNSKLTGGSLYINCISIRNIARVV